MNQLFRFAAPTLFGILLTPITTTRAGTINIDFQSSHAFSRLMDAPGLMGAGSHWQPVFHRFADVAQRADGTPLPEPLPRVAVIAASVSGNVSAPNSTRNRVQRDGISTPSDLLSIEITGLREDQPHKVILYFGDFGAGSMRSTYYLGNPKVAADPISPPNLQAAVEGRDYVVYENISTTESGRLVFVIGNDTDPTNSVAHIAGMQIQGWLPGEPFPSKTDLLISKKKKGGYTGNNLYQGRQLLKITGKAGDPGIEFTDPSQFP